jgi:LmbE family N-acetylglucosaminyl deacetylase
MLTLNLDHDAPCRILCLGAHCDDIEIGCGGTILRLIQQNVRVDVHWLVFSSNELRAQETTASAQLFLAGAAAHTISIRAFQDGYFPFLGAQIKECFEQLKHEYSPDIIFTHFRGDLHQDHRLISDLTWNTFRNHLILEYEIPKYDGDLGAPNCFVHLDEAICQRKVEYLQQSFPSQAQKHWFTEDTFLATLRIRGIESASPTKYAEGFYCRKLILLS